MKREINRRILLPVILACHAVAVGGAVGGQAAATAQDDVLLEQQLAREVAQFVASDRQAPPAPCQVLFVGSSSIVKWRQDLDRDMQPIPVINRGFGSSQIRYVNRWFDEIVAPYRPRAIVFYAGENDIDAGESPAQVLSDFDTFMRLKTEALGATPVYFISIKPSRRRLAELPEQKAVNEAVRARTRRRPDLHYIDVATPMMQNGRPRDIFEADDLHMTRAGYLIWRHAVRAALLPVAAEQGRRCSRHP